MWPFLAASALLAVLVALVVGESVFERDRRARRAQRRLGSGDRTKLR